MRTVCTSLLNQKCMLYLSFSDMIDRWSLDFCQQVATLFSTQQQEMQRGNTPTFFHRVAECAKGRGYPIETMKEYESA